MRRLTATIIVTLLACLGLADIGNAQVPQALQIQGTIQAVDCQAQQLTLNTSGGTTTLQSTGQTAIFVPGGLTQLCSLQAFIGAPAAVLVTPSDNQFILNRVDVGAPQAASQPALQAAPATGETPGASSTAGIILGGLLLGGLAYLLLNNSNANNNSYAPAGPHWPDRACRDKTRDRCRH